MPNVVSALPTLPLCIDLDGTLLLGDTLWEKLRILAIEQPGALPGAVTALFSGRAALKGYLAARVALRPETLPFRESLVSYAEAERRRGRSVYLVTGAHRKTALEIAGHLGIFDGVLATEGPVNLTGAAKADALARFFGSGGYGYIGDSRADLPAMLAAESYGAADLPGRMRAALERAGIGCEYAEAARTPLWRWLPQAMRMHHWAKNLLVLVPLLLGHRLTDPAALGQALWAFAALCLTASGIYAWNDVADVEADRRHPAKRRRPLAAGAVGLPAGVALGGVLLGAGIGLAAGCGAQTGVLVAAYAAASLLYTFVWKRKVFLDVVALGGLFSLRIFIGGAAAGIPISAWTMMFSLGIFTALAIGKRMAELSMTARSATMAVPGRGYQPRDLPVLTALAAASGLQAVLVIPLYVFFEAAHQGYQEPMTLVLLCPLLVYWLGRLLLLAQRGEMSHDPLVFVFGDGASRWCAVAAAATVGGAWVGL